MQKRAPPTTHREWDTASGRCQRGTPAEGIRPRAGHDWSGRGAETDLTQIVPQIVPYVLAHAQWVGPVLLGAGLLVRLLGRAIARFLFVAGVLATAAVAYQEYQLLHSTVVAGGILLVGLVIFALLAWTVRGLSFLFALALIAAAFYLILYGWAGPAYVATTTGELVWAGATILTMIAGGLRGFFARRMPVAGLAAGVAH